MTRTDAIKKKIAEELEPFRALIDSNGDLRAVRLEIRFAPGCVEPRSVVFVPEFERRKETRE